MNGPSWHTPGLLLRLAHAVMQQAQPTFSTTFVADGCAYRVRFEYPGRLIVSRRHDGLMIVRSRIGAPTKPGRPRARRSPQGTA